MNTKIQVGCYISVMLKCLLVVCAVRNRKRLSRQRRQGQHVTRGLGIVTAARPALSSPQLVLRSRPLNRSFRTGLPSCRSSSAAATPANKSSAISTGLKHHAVLPVHSVHTIKVSSCGDRWRCSTMLSLPAQPMAKGLAARSQTPQQASALPCLPTAHSCPALRRRHPKAQPRPRWVWGHYTPQPACSLQRLLPGGMLKLDPSQSAAVSLLACSMQPSSRQGRALSWSPSFLPGDMLKLGPPQSAAISLLACSMQHPAARVRLHHGL